MKSSPMKTTLIKTAGILFGSLMTMLLLVLLVNSAVFDQTLDPHFDGVEQLTPTQMSGNNRYFGFMGIRAANNKDFINAGQQLVEQYERNLMQNNQDTLTEQDYQMALGEQLKASEFDLLPQCQARTNTQCALEVTEALKDQDSISSEMEVFFARYQALLAIHDFQDPSICTVATPLAEFGTVMKISKLHLAHSFHQDPAMEFSQKLVADFNLWRSLLSDGKTLISKMVGVAGMQFDLQLLQLKKQDLAVNELLKSAILPLSVDELNIGEAFVFENKMMIREVLRMSETGEAIYQSGDSSDLFESLSNWFLQPHATANLSLDYFVRPLEYLSSLNSDQFAAELESFKAKQQEKEQALTLGFFNKLYNPTGKIVVSIGMMRGEDYIARVHDLNRNIIAATQSL